MHAKIPCTLVRFCGNRWRYLCFRDRHPINTAFAKTMWGNLCEAPSVLLYMWPSTKGSRPPQIPLFLPQTGVFPLTAIPPPFWPIGEVRICSRGPVLCYSLWELSSLVCTHLVRLWLSFMGGSLCVFSPVHWSLLPRLPAPCQSSSISLVIPVGTKSSPLIPQCIQRSF